MRCASRKSGLDPPWWTPDSGPRGPGRESRWEGPGYPPEFRAEAVRLYRESDRSMREIAQDLGISNESLRRWIHQADVDEGLQQGLTTEERREIRELRRRVRLLEEERDILKKPPPSSRGRTSRTGGDLPVHPRGECQPPGPDDVQGSRGLPIGVLRLVLPAAVGTHGRRRGAPPVDRADPRGLQGHLRPAEDPCRAPLRGRRVLTASPSPPITDAWTSSRSF
jgi:transposase